MPLTAVRTVPARFNAGHYGLYSSHNPSALVVWCPGQFTDQMDAAMLTACAKYAHRLVVNEHEANHIRAMRGGSLD